VRAPFCPPCGGALAFQTSSLPETSDPHYHVLGEVFAAILGDRISMGRLLVSVRGPNETPAAAEGGVHIADVAYPASALGTPYPLNTRAVRQNFDDAGFKHTPISTSIGEEQPVRSTACQAALGVAVAGADYIKFGLAGSNLKSAIYLGRNIVRSVREWFTEKKVYLAAFPKEGLVARTDPRTSIRGGTRANLTPLTMAVRRVGAPMQVSRLLGVVFD